MPAAAAGVLTAAGPFAYPLLESLFLMTMEPPPKLRFRAPAAFAPAPNGTAATLTSEFVEWQDRLAERIRPAAGPDLRRARQQSAAAHWLMNRLKKRTAARGAAV